MICKDKRYSPATHLWVLFTLDGDCKKYQLSSVTSTNNQHLKEQF